MVVGGFGCAIGSSGSLDPLGRGMRSDVECSRWPEPRLWRGNRVGGAAESSE